MNIVAKTVNSTAIKVTWQEPLYPNGDIYYRLYYWQSSEGAGTKRLAFDGPLLEHIVAGLHEYITYTFMLQAYNVKYLWTSEAINATETTHPAGEIVAFFLATNIAIASLFLLKLISKLLYTIQNPCLV